MESSEIKNLASKHGLHLTGEMTYNDMGLDFQVVMATDIHGKPWLLRIPRREDQAQQIEKEKEILNLARKHLSVAVPDWKIAQPDFVAYPLLENKPVLTYDAVTYEVFWNMDKDNPTFVSSLAQTLLEIHDIPPQEAAFRGIKSLSPHQARREMAEHFEYVKSELGLGTDLEMRLRKWIDTDRLWPDFTTFIHGDLFAGHILADPNGEISGIIDWSEGQVSDPAIDFSGHLAVFGEQGLRDLINVYERLGGKVWEGLFEQTVARHAASPLMYAVFALKTQEEVHINAAKNQLGLV